LKLNATLLPTDLAQNVFNKFFGLSLAQLASRKIVINVQDDDPIPHAGREGRVE
jgi:hypothetical protein